MYRCSCGLEFEHEEFYQEEYGSFPCCPECGGDDYEMVDLKEKLEREFDINEGLDYMLGIENIEDAISILKHALQWNPDVYGLSRIEKNAFRVFLVHMFRSRMNQEYGYYQSDRDAMIERLKADCLEDPTHYATFLASRTKTETQPVEEPQRAVS